LGIDVQPAEIAHRVAFAPSGRSRFTVHSSRYLMTAPLLIVDGDNLAHRAYHSTPKTVKAPDGTPTNAIVGFFSMLLTIWSREDLRGVFVAWDTLGVDTYRSELWPPYQTGRVFDREIVLQLNMLPDVCRAFGLGVGKQSGYEADDLMASAALAETLLGGNSLLLTTDRDSYQLVNDSVTVLSPQRGGLPPERIGPLQVVERMGVLPEQVPDFKALSGDASDKIPGLKGIGPKSAAALLLEHATLEGVLEGWSKPEEVELALRFREVVRMRPECAVELPASPPDWASGAEALRVLGAERLAERVSALAHLQAL
jgi:DNA polymerase-1